MADELDLLAGGPEVVLQVGETSVRVSPIRVRELAAFTRAVQPVLGEIHHELQGGDFLGAAMRLAAYHAEHVVDIVAVGARIEREWVLDRSVPELLELLGAVLSVNMDFFVRAVMPSLQAAVARIAATLESGSRPLNS